MLTLVLIALLLLAILVPTHGQNRRTRRRRPAARSLRDGLIYAGLALLIPLQVLAQESVVAPELPLNSTANIVVYGLFVIALPLFLRVFLQWQESRGADKREAAEKRLGQVLQLAEWAFWLTEEAKKMYPAAVPDSVLFAEAKLIAALEAVGIKPTAAELSLARSKWGAMHGQTKVQTQALRTAAAVAGASALPSPRASDSNVSAAKPPSPF